MMPSFSCLVVFPVATAATTGVFAQDNVPFNCIANAPSLLGTCGAELEAAGAYVPLNATTPASPEQLAALGDTWAESNLPTDVCCETIGEFVEAACICDPTLRGLLPGVGVNLDPIESVLRAASDACGTFEVLPCP